MLSYLASSFGTSEAALRLLISVLIAYPIVILYRLFLHKNSSITKTEANLIFTVCGILICIFNYGYEVYHSLLGVSFTFLMIHLLYKSKYLVPVCFIFHMSYLLIGYYKTSTENYDICWTMCHCVMVLHLIGLAFDVSDSVKKPDVLGISDTRPYKIPSLLEVFAFAYFPPTVIIGPQFSFKRFNEFLDHKYDIGVENFKYGLRRFAIGAFYLALYQVLNSLVVPDSFLLSDEFDNKNIIYKLLYVGLWGKNSLYKYISCWIISEGACICSGLAFISKDEKTGKEDWTGCSNIKLSIFENLYKFGDYVQSFNLQTNLWVLTYVYKRLKFLNNKNVSHISALLFLAIWHGFHDGYYMTFFLEFLIIHFEKEVEPLFKKNPKFQAFIQQPHIKVVVLIVLKLYTFIFTGYCLIPFVFLSFNKWWAIYKKLYFIGYIVILPMSFLWAPLIAKLLKTYFPYEKKTSENAVGSAVSENSHEKVN